MRPTFILSVTLLFSVISLRSLAGDAPLTIPVWPDVPPGSEGKPTEEKVRLAGKDGEHVVSNVHRPTLTVYLPAAGTATGAGVVICPGGGHRELWTDHEGHNVARWLAAHGVAGFVLKYRLAREEGSTYKVEVHSLADLQRAVQLVRSHAGEWRVDPDRLGVMGFSAGGELAALGSMRFLEPKPSATDSVDRQRSKPAFQALIYPGNSGSIAPTKDSPPAFLCCGFDDRQDISEGLAKVYLRFHEVGVPAELHIFTGVGHGFGLRGSNKMPVAEWPQRFLEWLGDQGFLKAKK